MKELIKISVGVVITVFLTVLTLGVVSGSKGKEYSVSDIPGIGSLLDAANAAGKSIGERMAKKAPKTA